MRWSQEDEVKTNHVVTFIPINPSPLGQKFHHPSPYPHQSQFSYKMIIKIITSGEEQNSGTAQKPKRTKRRVRNHGARNARQTRDQKSKTTETSQGTRETKPENKPNRTTRQGQTGTTATKNKETRREQESTKSNGSQGRARQAGDAKNQEQVDRQPQRRRPTAKPAKTRTKTSPNSTWDKHQPRRKHKEVNKKRARMPETEQTAALQSQLESVGVSNLSVVSKYTKYLTLRV
jgi:hypothetical protein